MFEKILADEKRLQGYANTTPVLTSRTLNRMIGAEVCFKCENFQRVGAFKFRGAFNSISQLSDAEKDKVIIRYGKDKLNKELTIDKIKEKETEKLRIK